MHYPFFTEFIMRKGKQGGFTLIELIIVIAIIGLLSVIGMAAIRDAKESARDARRVSDLSQLRLALFLYFDDYDSYPPTISGGGTTADISYNPPDGSIFSGVNNPLAPKYTSQVFVDPMNSPTYYYQYDTNQVDGNRNYKLCLLKESVNYTWRVFYSSGVFTEANSCTPL
jgi:prepilin-type N-terminal cleavage/methylation domain-containing protein